MIGKCRLNEETGNCDRVKYTHSSITVAWTPIFVTGLGSLIPMESKDASVENVYYRLGRFVFPIQSGETVANKAVVYYDAATDKVTTTSSATTHLIGIAIEAGTGTAGYVTVELLPYPLTAAISKENLNSGILPSNIVVYEGAAAAGGTQTTESIVVSGCLSTDEAWVKIKTAGVDTTAFVKSCKITTDGTIAAILNTPTGAGASLSYRVDRVVS